MMSAGPLQKQRGNALFLILIAVALFAALSYAITQSGRGSGSIAKEQADLEASQLFQYAGQLSQTIMRLMLTGACTDTTLSFESTEWSNPAFWVNPLAPADKSCHIFDPAGGGVSWRKPSGILAGVGMTQFNIVSGWQVENVGKTNGNGSGNEILLLSYVPEDVCRSVNRQAEVSGIPSTSTGVESIQPPQTWMAYGSFNVGAYGNPYGNPVSDRIGVNGYNGGAALNAKRMGCWLDSGVGKYYFFSILLER